MTDQNVSQAAANAANTATVARADIDSLPAGSAGPANGNVITGQGTDSGLNGADTVARTPAHVVAVQGAGATHSVSNGGVGVTGHFGVLTMNSDGTFHYVPNADVPAGVHDVFDYTLADAAGEQSSSTLTINLGVPGAATSQAASQQTNLPPGVVALPAGVQLSDVHVVGSDLVVHMPDGTQMVIPDGAIFVPQFVIGNVEVPAQNIEALLVDSEPKPTAGPPESAGGNFAGDVPPLDSGVPLGNLLPPTEFGYSPPQFGEPTGGINHQPTLVIGTTDNPIGVVDASESVFENGLPARGGLPAGSGEIADGNPGNNSDTSESNSGTIVFDAQDGLRSVTVDGATVSSIGQQIQGQYGILTITGIDLASGHITYSYTLMSNTAGDATQDVFSVVVTDSNGDAAAASLTVHIVDDVPAAHDDSASQAAQNAVVTVNVVANDIQGADGVNLATGVQLVSGSLTGTGAIHYNGDGTFTYTPTAGESGNVTFQYQVTDGDGDTSAATVTIHLLANSIPTISTSGDNSVDEAALSVGSNPGSTNETATGSININSPDGIGKLVVNGVNVTNGGTVVGADGTLTVSHNTDGTYSYSYTLTGPTSNDASGDNFTVAVTDGSGDTASTSLTINVIDDVPTAHADTGSVVEGATLAVASASGVLANDVPGADGLASGGGVVGVAAGSNTTNPVTGNVGTQITGTYGTLTLNADGSYSYHSTANLVPPAGATDTFVYTIADGDGDKSTTTLTINLSDSGIAAAPASGTVDEAGLPTGSNPGSSDITTGQLTVSGATGYTAETIVGSHGTLTLDANGSYSYTLTSPVTESPTANNGTDTVNGVETFTYTAHDGGGNTTTGTITINVIDDVPKLGTIQPLTADDNPSDPAASGTLHLTSGADGFASATISPNLTGVTSGGHALVGSQSGNVYTAYADLDHSGTVSAGDTAVFTITVDPTATNGQYTFDLQQALDGTIQTTPIDSSSAFGAGPAQTQILSGNSGALPLATISGWTTVGTSFNDATWLATGNAGNITEKAVNGATVGWGVDNNSFTTGEFMRFDFSQTTNYGGGYTPPSTILPNAASATFELVGYTASDTITFMLHYTDGSYETVTEHGNASHNATFTLGSAPAGQYIDYIELYADSAAPGKIDLISVGAQSTTVDVTIPVTLTFADGDGDQVTGSSTIHVADGLTASTPVAPVALDLNGDGTVHFLSASAGATFDYNGDGARESTAWVAPEDGILVHDANHSGTVDGASEFVFATGGQTDLQALTVFDTNHDGKLSAADADFGSFGVWQDANSNGVVDPGEYHTLAQLGITSISLTTNGVSYEAAGGDVTVAGTGTYTKADGTTGVLADASFWTGSRTTSTDIRSSNPLLSNPALLGAVAAAGLAASEPLAANSHNSSPMAAVAQTVGTQHTQSLAPVALTTASNHPASESSLLGAQNDSGVPQPQHDSHGSGTVAPDQHSSDHGQQQAALSPLPQGTDVPAHSPGSGGTPVVTNAIQMPAAAQLHAWVNAQHPAAETSQVHAGHQVGHILMDALAGGAGHGSAIDAILDNVASHGGPLQGLNPLASHFQGGVSNGDNGHLAAFTAIQLANMEHLIAHAHAAHPHG